MFTLYTGLVVFENTKIGQLTQTLSGSSGPWHQLYGATRGSSGICHFHFLSTHRIRKCTNTLYDYAIINY
jgi:hypothetical protein